jgi:hypothetical protein
VGHVDRLRLVAEDPLHGLLQHLRLELRGAGGGKAVAHAVGGEFAVGQAEAVADEKVAALRVADTHVVARVAGRVDEQEFAAGQRHRMPFRGFDDALFRDRNDLAVVAQRRIFAVDIHCRLP